MDCDGEEVSLVEEKEEEMVAFTGSKQPIKRTGWFLKPIATSSLYESVCSPIFPAHHRTTPLPLDAPDPQKILFRGWATPPKRWDQWVAKLQPIYNDLWKKVGIFDPIIATTYKFRRDPSSLFGVVSFWCEETNTFLFPWAEATVTLEDVMILGGFSVLGEPVRVNGPLEGELGEIESKMIKEHKGFSTTEASKPDNYIWIRHFMDQGQGGEREHIAFLCLWLSKLVFPGPPARTVRRCMISIAVRLARGIRIALAPAVLASLYRDLRAMKNYLAGNNSTRRSPLLVWAPFSILQHWLWERFSAPRPKSSTSVNFREPRAARWHDAHAKLELFLTISGLELPDEFQWRPYTIGLDCCCKPSFYRDSGGWVCGNAVADDDELASFSRCLRACELVGLDCVEKYLPQRVARQFGLDQDIPDSVPRSNSTWQIAWETYDIDELRLKFYVPLRLFESDVTVRYSIWWENVQRFLGEKMEGRKRKKARSLRNRKTRRVQDLYTIMLPNSVCPKNQQNGSKIGCVKPHEPLRNFTAMQIQHTPKAYESLKISLEPSETMHSDALRDVQAEKETSPGKSFVSDPTEIKDRGAAGDIKKAPFEGSANGPTVIEEPEEDLQVGSMMEATEVKYKKSEVELEIKKLKEEIASLEARVMDLETLDKVPKGRQEGWMPEGRGRGTNACRDSDVVT